MLDNSTVNGIRERLNLSEKQALYLIIAGVVLLLFIVILIMSNRASSRSVNLGNTNCPPGGCIRANPQANPVALACPPGGCIKGTPVALNQGNAAPNKGRFISGGQYYCTHCQHMGLPEFDRNGTPRCPVCGGIMKVNSCRAAENVAAGQGPGGGP